MLKLNKSQVDGLPFDFHQAVQDFVGAMQRHRFTEGEPAPAAPHAWVEQAVKRIPGEIGRPQGKRTPAIEGRPDDFVADYEIFDDSPPPPTLEERKAAIAKQLGVDAQLAVDAIDPPLKRRLAAMQYERAMATPEADRTADQKLRIQTSQAIMRKVEEIVFHMATMEHDLHDLTEAQLEKWKPGPFPT